MVGAWFRRWRRLLGAGLLLALLATMTAPLTALAEGGGAGPDSLLPASPLPVDPTSIPLYERYPLSHYTLNGDYGITHPGYAIANALMSGLFMVAAFLAKWTVRGVQFAFTLSLFEPLAPMVDEVMQGMRNTLWLPFLTAIILVLGGWAIWTGMLQRRYSEVWGVLGTALLLILAAVWAFDNTGTTLARVNEYSSIVSGKVLLIGTGSRSVQADGQTEALNRTITAAGESMWRSFILNPWAVANFGSVETASKEAYALPDVPGGRFLAANARDRVDLYKENGNGWLSTNEDFAMWQPDGGALGARFVVVLMTLVMTVVYAVMMLFIAGAVLFFQLLVLFWALWAPIVLLLGLVPGWGIRLVERWGLRLGGTILMKLALAFGFALLIRVSTGIYQVVDQIPGGWVLGPILQLVFLVGLWFYRTKIIDMFSSLGVGAVHRARATMEHSSEEFQASRSFRRAPAAAASRVRSTLAKSRQAFEQRQARGWAHRRLDQRVKTDKAYRSQVQDRIRRGMRRYTDDELQAQMRLYSTLKRDGQNPQQMLLTPVATADTEQYVTEQERFDREMEDARRTLDEQERVYGQRAQVAMQRKSWLGRWSQRWVGADSRNTATPRGPGPRGPGGPAGPAPASPPADSGTGSKVVGLFSRPISRPPKPVQASTPKAIRRRPQSQTQGTSERRR